jgi:hypothetical protein
MPGSFLQEAAAGRHGQPGQAAGGKPIYTRAQITQMASLRRKGVYSDAEWAAWEAELIAAGREGRVIGALDADGLSITR